MLPLAAVLRIVRSDFGSAVLALLVKCEGCRYSAGVAFGVAFGIGEVGNTPI